MATGQVRTEIELLELFKDNVTNDIYPLDLRDFVATMFFEVTGAITGAESFLYIAYADDAAGTGFTMAFDPTKDYIAIRNTTSEILTPGVGDFTGLWTKYRGDKGDQGLSLLTGIVDPVGGDGVDGDTFLNVATYDFFGPKSGGVWGAATNIIGNGIAGIALLSSFGNVDTYRITYTDATTFDYTVTNGLDGNDGVSVTGVSLLGSAANIDTYRMTFSDASFFDYTVTNSQDLAVGADGNIQIATTGVLDSDNNFNWNKTNNILKVDGDSDAKLFKSISHGTISTSGTGWYRVADFGTSTLRGTSEIVLSYPGIFGGNFSATYVIKASKRNRNSGGGYTFNGNIITETNGVATPISDVRMVVDGSSHTYLEVYATSTLSGIDIYETQTLGENTMGDSGATAPASTIYTGSLIATTGGTVLDEKPFISDGISANNITATNSLNNTGARYKHTRRQSASGTYLATDHIVELLNNVSVITLNLTASTEGREIIIRNISLTQNAQFRGIGPSMDIDGAVLGSLTSHTLWQGQSMTLYYSAGDNRWYNYN